MIVSAKAMMDTIGDVRGGCEEAGAWNGERRMRSYDPASAYGNDDAESSSSVGPLPLD